MRFDGLGQLWCEVNVFLLRRVTDINQHLTLGVGQIHIVVDMRAAALLCGGGAIGVLVGRLAAYLQSVLVPGTKLNDIYAIMGEVCESLLDFLTLSWERKKKAVSYILPSLIANAGSSGSTVSSSSPLLSRQITSCLLRRAGTKWETSPKIEAGSTIGEMRRY